MVYRPDGGTCHRLRIKVRLAAAIPANDKSLIISRFYNHYISALSLRPFDVATTAL